ncbi:MAG: hypothetical protein O3B27_03650 [Actinomycetota bacterium]|nr:hypothetical protein [Actinomycetota bacterium]MDA2948913.1 hypothetical protein [Actinomycetota bacterium]MDA2990643.1 hypothetical protein [Actinomycetota bacterium]
MTDCAAQFTVSRTETVQPYALLSRDGLVDLLGRFSPAAAELAGMDDTALMAVFSGLIDSDPDGLGDELIELTGNHQEILEVGGWRIISDSQPAHADTLPAPWQDDPEYPMGDWRYEVSNGDELRGYRDWVAYQRELAALD